MVGKSLEVQMIIPHDSLTVVFTAVGVKLADYAGSLASSIISARSTKQAALINAHEAQENREQANLHLMITALQSRVSEIERKYDDCEAKHLVAERTAIEMKTKYEAATLEIELLQKNMLALKSEVEKEGRKL